MGRIGKGVPIAEGIWRYKNGYRVQTKVHGVQKERWYRLESDPRNLPLERLKWEQERRTGEPLRAKHPFANAVENYLLTIPHWSNPDAPPKERKPTRRYVNAEHDLGAWLPALGKIDTTAITPQAIKEQLASWQQEGYAASTLNHRRQELKNLFTFLNGKAGANPVRDVPKIKERKAKARGVSPAVVEAVLAELRDSATKIRLRVIWETSLPHIDLTRIKQAHFSARDKTIYVEERHKGDGYEGELMALTTDGVKALEAFFAAGLEGQPFSTSSVYKSFKAAVKKARARWIGVWPAPENLRPYDLRHSRLTEALRRSKNLQGVQKLARHKRMETTMRYVRALESESMRHVVEAMEGSRQIVPAAEVETAKIARKSTSERTTRKPTKTR